MTNWGTWFIEKFLYFMIGSILMVTGLTIPFLFMDPKAEYGPFWGQVILACWTVVSVTVLAFILARLIGYQLGKRK